MSQSESESDLVKVQAAKPRDFVKLLAVASTKDVTQGDLLQKAAVGL